MENNNYKLHWDKAVNTDQTVVADEPWYNIKYNPHLSNILG
jgi:hypothetical protein